MSEEEGRPKPPPVSTRVAELRHWREALARELALVERLISEESGGRLTPGP